MAYLIVAVLLAVITGIWSDMSMFQLIIWVIFSAFAAIASELIVGISAMYSGWFPGFATALIFLIVGMLIGFPAIPLGILVAYTSATGPAFSDMAYDLKCGYILRGCGQDQELELEGRKQQYYSEMIGFVVAFVLVAIMAGKYFDQGLFAPVDATFAATIEAGAGAGVAKWLVIWAIPRRDHPASGRFQTGGHPFCYRSSGRLYHQWSDNPDRPCITLCSCKTQQRKRADTEYSGRRFSGRSRAVQFLHSNAFSWKEKVT